MYEHITKEYIRSHHFETREADPVQTTAASSLMLDRAAVARFEKRKSKLRMEILNLVNEKYDRNKAKFEAECDIGWELMKKCANGSREVTRTTLAKLSVGMRLPLEKTQELFKLEGHGLEPETSMFDAIVIDALKCGYDIGELYEECEKFNIKGFRKKGTKCTR